MYTMIKFYVHFDLYVQLSILNLHIYWYILFIGYILHPHVYQICNHMTHILLMPVSTCGFIYAFIHNFTVYSYEYWYFPIHIFILTLKP